MAGAGGPSGVMDDRVMLHTDNGAAGLRPALLAPALVGILITVLLGVPLAGENGPDPVDRVLTRWLEHALGGQFELMWLFVAPAQPAVLLPVLSVVVLVLVAGRRWTELLVAVAGPALAVALNTWVLKPAFGRFYYDDHLAYPSGHTVSLAAVATVLVLLARPGPATAVITAIGVLTVAAAGAGAVVLGYHYPTDIVGGAAFGVAVVCAVAAVVNARGRGAAASG